MKRRIMQVFYDNDCLPYKDSERTVHYPIVGNSFAGSNNVDTIRFYVRDIGGVENVTWVANAKLPNGKIIYQVLSTIGLDQELNEYYVELEVNNFYTQLKGDVYISLNGCDGNVEIVTDPETDIQTITAEINSRTIQTTGAIKLSINYAPQRPLGVGFEIDQYQNILDALSNKANVFTTIQVVASVTNIDLSNFSDGQLLYDISRKRYYKKIATSPYYEEAENKGILASEKLLYRVGEIQDQTFGEVYDLVGDNQLFLVDMLNEDDILTEYLCVFGQEQDSGHAQVTAFDLNYLQFFVYTDWYNEDPFYEVINTTPIKPVWQTSSPNRLYGTNQYGGQTTFPHSVQSTPNTFAQRTDDGNINVALIPNNNSQATSKKYVDDLVKAIKENELQVVSELPETGEEGIIYLLPIDPQDLSKGYYRYIWENNEWLSLGTTEIDLSNYYTIPQAEDTFVPYSGATKNVDINTRKISGQVSNSGNTKRGGFSISTDSHGSTIFEGLLQVTRWQVNREYQSMARYKADRIEFTPNMNQQQYNYVLYLPSENGTFATREYANTFGKTLECSIDSSTYIMTLVLKDNSGNALSTQTIDLPLETMVVSGSYNNTTKSLVLTLKNGQTINIPVGDLVDGLASESDLQELANNIENELENYARVDGNYPTLTVGLANNLNTKLEQNDDSAYLFRPAGGSLEIGDYCKEKAIVGGSLVFNQLMQNGNFNGNITNWQLINATASVSNNIATITISEGASGAAGIYQIIPNPLIGHKYFRTATIKPNFNGAFRIGQDSNAYPFLSLTNGQKTVISYITEYTQGNGAITIYNLNPQNHIGETFEISNAFVVDLTAMFGSTIADYIYSLEQATAGAGVAWFKRYFNKPYYPYTPIGGFIHVKTSGKKVVGFNQWDEEWEQGTLSGSTGLPITDPDRIRSKNFNNCLPNTTYSSAYPAGVILYVLWYDANQNFISFNGLTSVTTTVTSPANAHYFKISPANTYGGTYHNDICINFHYDGERDGEYEQYEEHTYPNDDIELIGIPHIDSQGNLYYEGNKYLPDGTVEKTFGIYTFTGNETVTEGTVLNGDARYLIALPDCKSVSVADVANAWLSSGYTLRSGNDVYYNNAGYSINLKNFNFYDANIQTLADFKSFITGKSIIYELETPTEDSATPFTETQQVDNWGTEERIDNREIPVPVGHETEYLTDLKSKLEILPNLPHNDGTYVVNVASGVCEYVPIGAWLSDNGWIKLTDISGYDSTKTQSLKNVNGTLTWVDD